MTKRQMRALDVIQKEVDKLVLRFNKLISVPVKNQAKVDIVRNELVEMIACEEYARSGGGFLYA